MLSTHYENIKNVMVVKLSGEVMAENVTQLKNRFIEYETNYKYFLFDFKNVTMIDSSGLGYIVYCLKEVRKNGGDVKIENLVDQAKLIFEITRINSVLDIYDNQNDALNSFNQMEHTYESNNSNLNEIIS